MIAAYRPAAARERVDAFHVVADSGSYDAVAKIRGDDYRIDVTIDGFAYAFGRHDGIRWRRTPSGTVRTIASDVQGDPLDRWPDAVVGFEPSNCRAAGETATEWVLACKPARDALHYLYVDPRAGTIAREAVREGAKIVRYAFHGASFAIEGFGGTANVAATETARPVSSDDVAVPASTSAIFALPAAGVARVPALFGRWIRIPVTIDGHASTFVFDSGTTQMLIDARAARSFGLTTRFGHTIASAVKVGDAVGRDVPMQVVDLFGGQASGLLGNEFFTGHIVHIDYRGSGKIELLDRTSFVPPPGASPLAAGFGEGLPIVAGSVDGVAGSRFALDTGSNLILVTDAFAAAAGVRARSATSQERFLEGPVSISRTSLRRLQFGAAVFDHPDAAVEVPDRENLDIPLDAIVGSDALAHFEWWFDYDGGLIWMRPIRHAGPTTTSSSCSR